MRVTNHTELRMKERGITAEHLVACIEHGKVVNHRADADKKVILGHKIIMVTSKNMDVLITVFPTKGKKHV